MSKMGILPTVFQNPMANHLFHTHPKFWEILSTKNNSQFHMGIIFHDTLTKLDGILFTIQPAKLYHNNDTAKGGEDDMIDE